MTNIALIRGLLLGLLLSFGMGPVVFAVIKQSITNGLKGGFSFILGVSASDFTLVTFSQLFSELIDNILDYKNVIAIIGSSILICIGLYYIFLKKINKNSLSIEGVSLSKTAGVKIFMSGYLMNILNPGVIGFWFILASSVGEYGLSYRITMFLTCLIVILLCDSLKVLLANKIRQRITLNTIKRINKIAGIVLILFGIGLIITNFVFKNKI